MAQEWMTKVEEVGDMRLGNRGRLLAMCGLARTGSVPWEVTEGKKLHHEGLQIGSNFNQAFALGRNKR